MLPDHPENPEYFKFMAEVINKGVDEIFEDLERFHPSFYEKIMLRFSLHWFICTHCTEWLF